MMPTTATTSIIVVPRCLRIVIAVPCTEAIVTKTLRDDSDHRVPSGNESTEARMTMGTKDLRARKGLVGRQKAAGDVDSGSAALRGLVTFQTG